ncbi:hypothetical protein RJ55_01180 [Drechmeria coniospora]|nr:hypothetical protein RJ55_01180 [Drechmeria coniospora]
MRAFGLPATLAALLAANLADAQSQYLVTDMSFGHAGTLSSADAHGKIKHFALSGKPIQPELLSNKVILTPVAPGNQRGAVWAENPLTRSTWSVDVDFRVSGPERGGGSLNIWLARQGGVEVGTHSIHSVGKFDGFALVIDSSARHGGMVRGFLNDGSIDYSRLATVDAMPFGQCKYAYRNLGRPSQVKIIQSPKSFRVEIDSKLCFETNKVSVPAGNFFGITGASADNPDSIEVFKLVVLSESTVSGDGDAKPIPVKYATQQQQPPAVTPNKPNMAKAAAKVPADQPAEKFTSSKEQFEDLHNRLQSAMHQIADVHDSVLQKQQEEEQHHLDVKQAIDALRTQILRLQQSDLLLNRIKDLESEVHGLRTDLGSKFNAHDESFQGYLSHHHATLRNVVANSVPGHGKVIFFLIGSQMAVVGAYILYKKRKNNNNMKKFL